MPAMPTSQYLQQYQTSEKISSEPWPDDAQLYQPYEVEQILLPEQASCLAVKAYLKMCNLPFEVRSCANAEFMSPGGRMTKLPFLRAGAYVTAEFEQIVKFIEQKRISEIELDEDERMDMRTYLSMTENIFTMAEMYMCFVNQSVNPLTCKRIGDVYPWPLNLLQIFRKRRNALRMLRVYQWNEMSIDDVIAKVEKCCESLVSKLDQRKMDYFYGDKPCELDAIVFGHLYAILTTTLPDKTLAQAVEKFTPLVAFCKHIEQTFFQRDSLPKN